MAFNHEYPYVDPNRINGDWLLNQVKDFRETLESWRETIEQLQEALTTIDAFDARITRLEEAVEVLNPLINKVEDIEKSIADLYKADSDTNQRIDNIIVNYELVLEEFARLQALLPEFLKLAENYTDREVEKLFIKFKVEINRIDEAIEELRRLRPEELLNPVRATVNDLQKSYDLAYADMRDDALTNEQLGELGLTNNELAALDFTNLNFALHSRTLLKWDYVFAPISGIKKSVSNALSEVVTFILGTLSNTQYAALDLTNDEYAALNLTNEEFLLYDPSVRGLTNDEYNNILKSGGSNILRL